MLNIVSFVSFLSEAAQTEFARTCAIFALAAFVHSRQVRIEIKDQFTELVNVLKKDLEGQRFLLGNLSNRVSKIEERLTTAIPQPKEKPNEPI
jgi:hypothetical protein